MPFSRRALYISAIMLTALTLILTGAMVVSTYRNLDRERRQMEYALTREAMALMSLFHQMLPEGSLTGETDLSRVQELSSAAASGEDVEYIYLFDKEGRIRIHSDPTQIGRALRRNIPVPGEVSHSQHVQDGRRVFEVRRSLPAGQPGRADVYLGIGLRMGKLAQSHEADRKHTLMMMAILILLGFASLFFILVVQNFYIVQRTLERVKSYVHYVIESMADGLVSVDAQGNVTTINPVAAELIGVSESEGQHRAFTILFPEHANRFQEVLEHGRPILNEELIYERPDGSLVPMSLSATQVRDNQGSNLGAVVVLHDLREVRELQARARRVEHLASIGRMAATVAHEIRNPLSSIRGFAQYFANLFEDGDEERTYATAMMQESDRLNHVVTELLNYARPMELRLGPVSISDLFADTVRMIQREADAQGIEIQQHIDPTMPPLRLDRDRMLQVLLNLVQNSMAAMPDGGLLALDATWLATEQTLHITVEDNGVGIPEQDLPRLFDPFFTTKSRGTGLGLAVVRKIIDAHQGDIDVRSQGGKGTCVQLDLPHPAEPL